MLKNKKGITLVALVVTIVILLILAGVSINLILSDNGLIKKANLAKKRSNSSKLIENIQNAWNECIIMSNESGQEEQEYFEENFLQVLESNDINVTEIAININGTSIVKVKKDERIIIYCISKDLGIYHICDYDVDKKEKVAKCSICENEIEVVNVKDYDAKGDGITNDSSAIKKAIVEANNKILYIPNGTYNILDAIILVGINNVKIIGDDNTTLVVNDGFKLQDVENIEIKSINFMQNDNKKFQQDIFIMETPNAKCDNVVIRNCTFSDGRGGIKFNSYLDHFPLYNIVLDSIVVKNCVAPIYMDSIINLTALNIYVNQTTEYEDISKLDHHIYISKNCDNMVWSDTTIDGGIDNSIANYNGAINIATAYENTQLYNIEFNMLNVINRENKTYYALIDTGHCENLIVKKLKIEDPTTSYNMIIYNYASNTTIKDSYINCKGASFQNISSIDGQDFLKIENNNINTSTLDNLSSYWVLCPKKGSIICENSSFKLNSVGKNFRLLNCNDKNSKIEFLNNKVEWLSNATDGSIYGNYILDCGNDGCNVKIDGNEFLANNLCNLAFTISKNIENYNIIIEKNRFVDFASKYSLFSNIGKMEQDVGYKDNEIVYNTK